MVKRWGDPYLCALTVVFAVLIHFIKGKGRGCLKDSQVVPDPLARYGQVIKQRAGLRLVSVARRVVFGAAELILLKQISTSLLERLKRCYNFKDNVRSTHFSETTILVVSHAFTGLISGMVLWK